MRIWYIMPLSPVSCLNFYQLHCGELYGFSIILYKMTRNRHKDEFTFNSLTIPTTFYGIDKIV